MTFTKHGRASACAGASVLARMRARAVVPQHMGLLHWEDPQGLVTRP
jgi:hypothetical protein